MIYRQGRKIECDGCSEVYAGADSETFDEWWAKAKAAGWRSRMIDKEWVHFCPRCSWAAAAPGV